MQPAAFVPCRGLLAAALVITATTFAPPPSEVLAVPLVPPQFEHWAPANHLANAIAQARWAEIEEAASAIASRSQYAMWMPAAIALAIASPAARSTPEPR